MEPNDGGARESAVLAGGCFWCLEAGYQLLRGVESVEPGYAGGSVEDPTYRQVCSGTTGHAEVVRVTYDPEVISYGDLLDAFFALHDPTQLNRQGADVGTQYRSAIFPATEEQERVAREKLEQLSTSGVYDDAIVTTIEPLDRFWPAEDYHREYYRSHPSQPYCRIVIDPKVSKLRKKFADKLA